MKRTGYLITMLAGLLIGAAAPLQALPPPQGMHDSLLLAKGRLALEDSFYHTASNAFLQLLERDRGEPDTAESAAHYYLQTLYEQRLLVQLADSIAEFKDGNYLPAAGAVYWRAMLDDAAGDQDAALRTLSFFEREEAREDSFVERGLHLKALIHFRTGQLAAAADRLRELEMDFPDSPHAARYRFQRGLVWFAARDFDAAQRAWQPLLSAEAEAAEAAAWRHDVFFWSGMAHLQTGAVLQAEAQLQPLVENEDLAELLRLNAILALSEVRRQQDRVDEGVALLAEAVDRTRAAGLQQRLQHALCLLLLTEGQLETAIPRVRAFVAEHASDAMAPPLLLRLGSALLEAGRHAEAADIFQQYLEAFGDEGGLAYRGRGLALTGIGRHAEAAAAFERAAGLIEEARLEADSLFRAGDARYASRQYGQALEIYDTFSQRFPDASLAVRAMYQSGVCRVALGEREAAEAQFERLVQTHPETAEAVAALLAIGELRLEYEMWESAVSAFDRVMEVYPDSEAFLRALHGRGMARYHRWVPEAIEDFERVAAEADDPSLAQHAAFMRVMCLSRLGRDTQALAVSRDFREQNPHSEWAPPLHFWIARFEYNTGNYEVAETEFRSFVEAYPQHELAPQGLLRAGLAAMKRQQYVRAIEVFGMLVKQYPDSNLLAEARFQQAEALVHLGRFSAAILVYDELVNSHPDSELVSMAWGRRGDCLFTLGADDPVRFDEAVHAYQVVLKTPSLRLDHRLQAEYKLGLTFQKLGREEDALEQYYANVMLPFLLARETEAELNDAAHTWFSRAALAATEITERRKDWRRLVRLLERVSAADVELSSEARERIASVKADYWWMFY